MWHMGQSGSFVQSFFFCSGAFSFLFLNEKNFINSNKPQQDNNAKCNHYPAKGDFYDSIVFRMPRTNLTECVFIRSEYKKNYERYDKHDVIYKQIAKSLQKSIFCGKQADNRNINSAGTRECAKPNKKRTYNDARKRRFGKPVFKRSLRKARDLEFNWEFWCKDRK